MSLVKSFNRNILLPLIKTSRFSELIAKYSSNNNLILNYHGVVKKYNPLLTKNHLPLEQFEAQMEYFKKNFTILSLEEIFYNKGKKTKIVSRKNIAITFDDGYLNNFENAFPVLNSLNLPSTIFVTGQSIENPTSPLWYDLLDILASQLSWASLKNELMTTLKDGLDISKFNSYSEMKVFVKTTSPIFKIKLLKILSSNVFLKSEFEKCDPEYWKLMNFQTLQEISKSKLIEIGSHGLTHSNLDKIDAVDLNNELLNSRKGLQDCIQKSVNSIAFPDGAYNKSVINACHEVGYTKLLAVNYKKREDKKISNLLPRLSISNTTTSNAIVIKTNISFPSLGF